ncbi:acyl-CoA dehydrogenase family protein [Streptomyces sp. RTd22]|uniref:acyl-CoA dehydrogenase family protein n=1 Tax=Streptomyces sp. RTd22 TaxID=1841249 RepID=UPI000A43AA99|nr:acyl-CoA dehydrogenase family protein [Streptomyces sp. RTd22]
MIDAFSDEQTEFARLAAKAFGSLADGVAAPGDAEVAAARATFAGIGLPLLAVPEESGGAGMTETDVVLIVEEAGYADVPVPIAETVGVVAPMVARYGTAEQRERWLPALAAGDSLGATMCPSGGIGTRRGADLVLVEHAGRVCVTEAGALAAGGVAWTGSALGEPETSVEELRTRGAWVTAALLNGVARRLLELSVEQARTREQFGAPIGSFQAVKHMLADMAAGVESARPTAWSAARALAADDPGSGLAAAVAKAVASRAGALANDHALQIHGGMGFTREHPLHRWLLYGHELQSRWGSAATHQAALGGFATAGGSLIETFIP